VYTRILILFGELDQAGNSIDNLLLSGNELFHFKRVFDRLFTERGKRIQYHQVVLDVVPGDARKRVQFPASVLR